MWGSTAMPISNFPERVRPLSDKETQFVKAIVITYTVPLEFAVKLIAEAAAISTSSLDECIEFVECERFEGRAWLPYKAWYTSIAPRPIVSALQSMPPPYNVSDAMLTAAYCYDVEMLGNMTRHALLTLSRDQLDLVETTAAQLLTKKAACKASLSFTILASVCGISPDNICITRCIYILLAYIFTTAGGIVRAIDPAPLSEFYSVSCLSRSTQFPPLLVLQLHP